MARGMLSGIITGAVVTVLGLGTASVVMGPNEPEMASQAPSGGTSGATGGEASTPGTTPSTEADGGVGSVDAASDGDSDGASDGASDAASDGASDGATDQDGVTDVAEDATAMDADAETDTLTGDADGQADGDAEAEAGVETDADPDTGPDTGPDAGADSGPDTGQDSDDATFSAGDGDGPASAEAMTGEPDQLDQPADTADMADTTDTADSTDNTDAAADDTVEAGGGEADAAQEDDGVVFVEPEEMPEMSGPQPADTDAGSDTGSDMARASGADMDADPDVMAEGGPVEGVAPGGANADDTDGGGTTGGADAGTGADPAADPAADPDTVVAIEIEPDAPLQDEPGAGVITGRLPSIGGDAAPEADAPGAEPAITRNAIAFEAKGEGPLMSILLLDTGGDRSGMGDLGKLPFPVTVAVDASAPDAAEAEAFYRQAGAEVVLILPLPEGATATDVDVTLEAYGPLLAPASAVLVDEASGFQTLGEAALQVATNLVESGHGLVTFPSGLNTGHKAAVKEGVKAGMVFRDLDGDGQGGPVIRRFLDNAAFRARNEEGVIVIARTRPETVQALLEWSLGNRAQAVRLAPISAVLSAGK